MRDKRRARKRRNVFMDIDILLKLSFKFIDLIVTLLTLLINFKYGFNRY